MTDTRIYVLVGAFLIGATLPSAANDGDGKNNGATQRSIYDVVRGEFISGYQPLLLQEGRAATAEPLPSAQPYQEPEYMRRESDYVRGQ